MIWQNIAWQDMVITIALTIFSVSLIPQVYYGFKKRKGYITLKTSVPTFLGLCVIIVAYSSLGLVFSSIMTMAAAAMWLLLLIQRMMYEKV